LSEQFDIFRECIDELGHDSVGEYDAGDDAAGSWEVSDEVQNEFGRTGDDDNPGADFTAGDVIGDTGAHGGHVIEGVLRIAVGVGHGWEFSSGADGSIAFR
jgi:hypothetical protein